MKYTAALAAFIACAAATEAAPAAPACTFSKIVAFKDKDCKEAADKALDDKVKAVSEAWKTKAKEFKAACVKDGDVYKTPVCNGEGYGVKYYKEKGCKTELTADTDPKVTDVQTKAFNKWGDKSCIATSEAAVWIQITTASFIKATAVAAVAVAASLY